MTRSLAASKFDRCLQSPRSRISSHIPLRATHVARLSSRPPQQQERRRGAPAAAAAAGHHEQPSHGALPSSSSGGQQHGGGQQLGGDWDTDHLLQLLQQRRQAAAAATTSSSPQQPARSGRVFLVGTGPGDPGLLTLRAVQLMQAADVVLYDRLVSDDILRLVHSGARMVYVGKQAGYHTRTQAEIHELLLQFAEAGATVVRLKGGDPYVFGRGGEEVQYLAAQGITVQCVPGVTAAAGICAELGIPMTHRGLATSVRFLTGHTREGGQVMLDDTLIAAADPHTTLVVYMGLSTLPQLEAQLRAHGVPADTPAVAVERGTTSEQRVVFGTLQELHAAIGAAGLASPTLLIIGQVVGLAPAWQEWQAAAADGGCSSAAALAAERADIRHDCARLQLPDVVSAVLQSQQQQQQQQAEEHEAPAMPAMRSNL